MKQFLLVFLVILWPATARATLFTYDISVTMLAGYLADPRFGDVAIAVSFPQETSIDYPYNDFQLPNIPAALRPRFSVDGGFPLGSMFWSLGQVSLMDYRFWIGDPAGNIYMDLLYDHIQAANAPFREPDSLLVNFGYELSAAGMGWCNTPTTGPCPIGTGGVHTFNQGEFSFERSQVNQVAEPAALVLLACGLLLIGVLKVRYYFLTVAFL